MFLIQSGVNQFILDDLGRSPSDLDPSSEVRLHSIIDIDSDGHTDSASPIEYDTECQSRWGSSMQNTSWFDSGCDGMKMREGMRCPIQIPKFRKFGDKC